MREVVTDVVWLVVAVVVGDVVADVVPVVVAVDVGVVVVCVVVCDVVCEVVTVDVTVVVGVVRTQFEKLLSSKALTASFSNCTIALHSARDDGFDDAARRPPGKQEKVPDWVPRVKELMRPLIAWVPVRHRASSKPRDTIPTAGNCGSAEHWNGNAPTQPSYMRCKKPIRYVQSVIGFAAAVLDTKYSPWNSAHANACRTAVVVTVVVIVVVTVVESPLPARTSTDGREVFGLICASTG